MVRTRPNRGLVLSAAAAAWLVLAGPASQAQQAGTFWPADVPLQARGYDYWRVWLTRSQVRETPTSPYNLTERQATLRLWMDELTARKVPAADVASKDRLTKLGQLLSGRTQDVAAACREVDAIYRGLEKLVQGKETAHGIGEIRGKIVDSGGSAVEGADVALWGTPLGAISDAAGCFTIRSIPCSGPRWVVWVRKGGFLDGFAGGLNPEPGGPAEVLVTVDAVTPESQYRAETLVVRFARLVDVKQVVDPAQPIELALVAPDRYPEQVKPYLKPAANVDSDSSSVVSQAQQILASVPEPDRGQSTAVARAVYGWLVRNIALDLTASTPDDATCGQWQLGSGAWSLSLDDWLQKPSETLAERRGVGLELSRLSAALLRAVGVAARPATVWGQSVCQWWVQLPAGNGYWANMDPAGGRAELLRTGKAEARFPAVGDDQVGCYGVDERATVDMAWNAAQPLLWLQERGELLRVGRSDKGLASARASLDAFGVGGTLPGAKAQDDLLTPARGAAGYVASWSGFAARLCTQGETRQLSARFPMHVTNQYRTTLDAKHWTNHPEWVKAVRREREQNSFTGESVDWYCVDFELGAAARVAPPAPGPAQ
jgi:hypothetical protein